LKPIGRKSFSLLEIEGFASSDFLTCQQQILEKVAAGKIIQDFMTTPKRSKKFNMDEQDAQDLQLLSCASCLSM